MAYYGRESNLRIGLRWAGITVLIGSLLALILAFGSCTISVFKDIGKSLDSDISLVTLEKIEKIDDNYKLTFDNDSRFGTVSHVVCMSSAGGMTLNSKYKITLSESSYEGEEVSLTSINNGEGNANYFELNLENVNTGCGSKIFYMTNDFSVGKQYLIILKKVE